MAKKKNNVDILKVANKVKKGNSELLQQKNVRQALDDYGKTLKNQDKRISTRKKVIITVSALVGVALLSIPAIISLTGKTKYIYPFLDFNIEEISDDAVKMRKGDTIGHLTVKEIPGYRFDGWYADANFTTKLHNDTELQNKETIYGRYIKVSNIALTINNFTHNIQYDYGLTLNEILNNEDLDITEFNSCGWFMDADLLTPYNNNLVDNLHLYTKTATLNKLHFTKIENSNNYIATLNENTNSQSVGNLVVPKQYESGNVIDFNFAECNISNLIIPSTVTEISSGSLFNATVGSINLTTNLIKICSNAFEQTTIDSITLPNTIQEIEKEAFKGSGLNKIEFNGVKIKGIKTGTFENCENLKVINLLSCTELESIELNSFNNCTNLTTIYIPSSTTNIDCSTFKTCQSLENIIIDEHNQVYDSRNNSNAIIDTTSNTLLFGCKKTTIPSSVVTIGENAFSDCLGLTSIDIPNGVKTIRDSAFENCSNLINVSLQNSIQTIKDKAFKNCKKLQNVILPNKLTTINSEVFANCYNLTSIIIPETISDNAFNAAGLVSFHLPRYVENFSPSAIENCICLTTITVDGLNATFDSRNTCNAIIKTDSNTLVAGCANTIIPIDVVTIGEGAFKNCSTLTSISIPSSVTTIESYAFAGCSGLTAIELPIEVEKIGANAFKDCSSLISLKIPSTTTKVIYYTHPVTNQLVMKTVTIDSTGLWYKVQNFTDWQNSTNGTHCDISDTGINAVWFTTTEDYCDFYWYKLDDKKTD